MGWIDRMLGLVEKGAARIASRAAALREADPIHKPLAVPTVPTDAEPRVMGAAALTDHIRTMVKGGGVTGGAVHFLNLAEIRIRFADRWGVMAARVAAVAEGVLDHRLARIDMFTRLEGPAYLIVFANANEDAAKLRCALIGQEIQRQLFGEDSAFSDVRVRASVFRLGREVKVEHIDLDAAIERLRPVEALSEMPAAGWGQAPAAAMAALTGTLDGGDHGFADGRPTRFVFRPILHVRAEAVASFVCQPQHRAADNDDDFVACTAAAADLPTLIRAMQELERARHDGQQLIVTAGLHFSTLSRSVDRHAYIAQCARLPEGDRRRLLFELDGCDETVPQTRLMELIAGLSPYGRAVALRVPLSRRRFAGIREARGFAVSADCSALRDGDPRAVDQLRGFAAAATAAGLRSCAHNVPTPGLAGIAAAAGFDFVDGDPVGPALDQGRSAYRFHIGDLSARVPPLQASA